MHDLRTSVYRHLQRLSLAFFTRTRTGDVQSRIANDIGGIDTVVTSTATSVLSNVTTVIATVVADDPARLAARGVRARPAAALRLADEARRRRAQEGDRRASGLARRRLLDRAGVALGLGDPARQDDGPLRRPRRAVLGRVEAPGRPRGAEPDDRALDDGRDPDDLRGDARARLLVRRLVAGARLRRSISIGTLVAFTTLQTRLFFPIGSLLGVQLEVQSSLALFDRIFDYLDQPIDIVEGTRTLERPRGDVAFDHVCFRYDEDAWTLEDVSFNVPAGTKTALVGETGSGKTTCGYLVARLYDATEGTVSIDGVDVRELTFESLAAAVGVVSQETYLFHSTVRENLRFAKPDATDEEVEEAARAAQIHDLIASLPDGYDTVVGERGYRFSGGEKQRMAIARTVLRNPPILVLDEATSALDTQTERLVQEALERLAEGRTTIAIAHRLSTVRDADQIVVLDRGRVAETGTHDELLAAGGRYAPLVARDADVEPESQGAVRRDSLSRGESGKAHTDRWCRCVRYAGCRYVLGARSDSLTTYDSMSTEALR